VTRIRIFGSPIVALVGALLSCPASAQSDWDKRKEYLRLYNGIEYELTYAPVIQSSPNQNWKATANHELDFIGSWTPASGSGSLHWWVLNLLEYGDLSTSAFSNNLGIISDPNDGDLGGDRSFTGLALFWWQQELSDGVNLNIGKLGLAELVGKNRYAHDGRSDFFNTVVTGDVVAGYNVQDSGLGVSAEVRRPSWYAMGYVADGSAEANWIDFDSFGDGVWQYGAELGFTPDISGLGTGMYRFNVTGIDAIETSSGIKRNGWGIGFSADQDIGANHAVFARFSQSVRQMTEFRQVFAAGYIRKAPLGRVDDRIGLAAWHVDPEDPTLRNEKGLEAYWSFQLSDHASITPDLQIILDPARDRSRDQVAILGLRLRVVF
jgi:carbohydrate-selective porin (OprB family)